MIPWTTPTITLTVEGIEDLDFTDAVEIVATFRQGGLFKLNKSGEAVTPTAGPSVEVFLSEQETALFEEGEDVSVMLNWTYRDVDNSLKRAAAGPFIIPVGDQDYKVAMTT